MKSQADAKHTVKLQVNLICLPILHGFQQNLSSFQSYKYTEPGYMICQCRYMYIQIYYILDIYFRHQAVALTYQHLQKRLKSNAGGRGRHPLHQTWERKSTTYCALQCETIDYDRRTAHIQTYAFILTLYLLRRIRPFTLHSKIYLQFAILFAFFRIKYSVGTYQHFANVTGTGIIQNSKLQMNTLRMYS